MKNMMSYLLITLCSFSAVANSELHLIYVNGVTEKTVEPNMLVVRFESWAKADSAQKAQEQQAKQMQNFRLQLEKNKIKKEDIQTESFQVNPEYTYDQKTYKNSITGYKVNHVVKVIYRKVDEAGSFLDSIVTSKKDTSGINVTSVEWDSDKKSEVEMAALADAVKNARTRANELAQAAGVKIKSVHKIQHYTRQAPEPQPVFHKAAMMAESDMAVAPATSLSSGSIKVRVEVSMEFEI